MGRHQKRTIKHAITGAVMKIKYNTTIKPQAPWTLIFWAIHELQTNYKKTKPGLKLLQIDFPIVNPGL